MIEYQVGGSLAVDDPTYIERRSDAELYTALLKRELCYVLASRQMGKSSLRLRIRNRLEVEGQGRCAAIDMTRIGSNTITINQWYLGIAFDLLRSLKLYTTIDLATWWTDQGDLSPVQKLGYFIEDIILKEIVSEQVFVFIDEIDSIQSLSFSVDDFFALIRSCYNQRVERSDYQRLVWAIFGVSSPSRLMKDIERTPFNIGTAIGLSGFTLHEAMPLLAGLDPYFNHPERVLNHILSWTEGQPFLTQKICSIVQKKGQDIGKMKISDQQDKLWIENLIRLEIIDNWQMKDEPEHLRTIQRFILNNPLQRGRILGFYQRILLSQSGIPEEAISDINELMPLLLSGLLMKRKGSYCLHNRIYGEVFNHQWTQQQLARIRPYQAQLDNWIQSNCEDEACLLEGKNLIAAQHWSQDKSLSDVDYQFLAASQLRDRRHREYQIIEILSILTYRSDDLIPYLKDIARSVSQLLLMDWSVVTLCTQDQERILASSFNIDNDVEATYSLHMTLTQYVYNHGHALIVEDVETHANLGNPPPGYRSYLGVPLQLSTGAIIGTVCSFHTTARTYTDDDLKLAAIFAERAASAIETYQIYQEIELTNQALQAQISRQNQDPLKKLWRWIANKNKQTDNEI